jgi:hypothetical protein
LDALDDSVLVPDDVHAFSAVPFGQPLFCYLLELFERTRINNGFSGPHNEFDLPVGSGSAIKKPAKKLFRVLAGMGYKPKRLFATCFIK